MPYGLILVCLMLLRGTHACWLFFLPIHPNSQPAPAYDLLVRFLTSQSFIDLNLPQVRSSHPVTPKDLDWMHPYPTGESAYIDSFNGNNAEETVGATLGAALGGASSNGGSYHPFHSQQQQQQEQHGGTFLAFVAGLMVAVIGMNLLQARRNSSRRREGYAVVPES